MEEIERKVQRSFLNLHNALKRLEEALQEDQENSLIIDGTIQRFEFTIELYWKLLKRLLLTEGIETRTLRETLKAAYQVGWLQNEESWLQMLKDRNETSHVYEEEMARRIVHHINSYFPEMRATFQYLTDRYSTGMDSYE